MKIARFVLKVVAFSLAAAAVICAAIAYWDELVSLGSSAGEKLKAKAGRSSEYDDYVEE